MYKPTFLYNSKINQFTNKKLNIDISNSTFYFEHSLPEPALSKEESLLPFNFNIDLLSFQSANIDSSSNNRKYVGVRIDPEPPDQPVLLGSSASIIDPYGDEKEKCKVP